MAAGRGQRMMPLTKHIPKAMAIHNGTTLIASGIKKIKKNIKYVHITVGYKGAMLARHVIEHNVSSVFNTEGQGNAFWIYNTLMQYIDGPVLVLTCDNIIELDIDLIADNYFQLNSPACMLVPVIPVKGLDGDYIFHQDKRVIEINRHKQSEIYCSGIQVLNPKKMNAITRTVNNFYMVWKQLIQLKEIYISSVYPRKWFAVDTLQQLESINGL